MECYVIDFGLFQCFLSFFIIRTLFFRRKEILILEVWPLAFLRNSIKFN